MLIPVSSGEALCREKSMALVSGKEKNVVLLKDLGAPVQKAALGKIAEHPSFLTTDEAADLTGTWNCW